MVDQSSKLRVVIVGGGAAGFFAAIRAAELNPSAQVILLEGTRRPLTKVRISGGGRCNVTHNCFEPRLLCDHYPRGGKELLSAFSRFQPRDTVAWFEARGVKLKAEADGRMFPVTDSSATIIECLTTALAKSGAELKLGAIVRGVTRDDSGRFALAMHGGETIWADRLLLATGGAPDGYDIARRLGHTIEPLVPSLFTFEIKDPRLAGLPGVAFLEAELKLGKLSRRGPLLITHWGLSGPAVLRLSAFGARELQATNYQADLTINFLAGTSTTAALAGLRRFKDEQARRTVLAHSPFEVPRRFWERLVELTGNAGGKTWADVTKDSMQALANELTGARYRITGKGEFKEEFVTAGGVKRAEIDFRTMASRVVTGLYFAGEIIDVDGVTGGFNFQNAWTTAWIAAAGVADVNAGAPSR